LWNWIYQRQWRYNNRHNIWQVVLEKMLHIRNRSGFEMLQAKKRDVTHDGDTLFMDYFFVAVILLVINCM